MHRRKFIIGMASTLVAAPVIVKADALMPIRQMLADSTSRSYGHPGYPFFMHHYFVNHTGLYVAKIRHEIGDEWYLDGNFIRIGERWDEETIAQHEMCNS